MTVKRSPSASHKQGFTLIELLVVVAIIALLISILLPSLGTARKQARGSICATRIAQLCKAVITYSEDYNETPPFLGLGWDDLKDLGDDTSKAPYDLSKMTDRQWAYAEEWCSKTIVGNVQGVTGNITWFSRQEDWPALASAAGVNYSEEWVPRSGTLFNYARFTNLYRCPEFERVTNADKSQNAFNYTRSILGRKWILPPWLIKEDDWWEPESLTLQLGAPGHIMKPSQVHAPSNLTMLYDEWWKRNVAGDPMVVLTDSHPNKDLVTGAWMGCDTIYYPVGDELGQYHGARKRGYPLVNGEPSLVEQGSVCFYDGHVELRRDLWPERTFAITDVPKMFEEVLREVFAQRGVNVSLSALP